MHNYAALLHSFNQVLFLMVRIGIDLGFTQISAELTSSMFYEECKNLMCIYRGCIRAWPRKWLTSNTLFSSIYHVRKNDCLVRLSHY